MTAEQSNSVATDPPRTFSLRTMFLVVTCFAIFSAGFRINQPHCGVVGGLLVGALFVLSFLTVWFFITDRRRASARVLIKVIPMLLVCALILPLLDNGRVYSPRSQCLNNLKQIGLALLEYHQKYGSFPPAYVADAHGKPLYSWRVAILPFLYVQNLYNSIQLDQPWDSASNSKWSKISPPVYQCPQGQQAAAMTDYFVLVGPNTAWPGAKGSKLADFKNPSETILVVEIADSGINWAEPRDLYIGQMAPGVNPKAGQGISSHHTKLVNVLFADCSIRSFDDDTDPEILARMLEIRPKGDFIMPP